MQNAFRANFGFLATFIFGLIGSETAALADRQNNVLTIGAQAESFTLDPAVGVNGNDYPYLYTIFDRLINLDPNSLEPKPGLAESWKFGGEGNRTLTLKLRSGVKFQDGTAMDAQAVKDNLDYFIGAGRIGDLSVVKSVSVVDPLTVAILMNQEYSPILSILADRAGMISSPAAIKKFGKDYGRNPVGAGPFMLKKWASGSALELVRFPDYWNKDRIKLDGITFKFIPNGTSLVSAAITGQIDYAYNLDPKNYDILINRTNVRTVVEKSVGFNQIAIHLGYPPMDNVLVRQAISMSIDREALARVALGNMKTEGAAVLPVPPSSYASDPAYATQKYDPQKAKQLLDEAGYPNGLTLKICASSDLPGMGTEMTDVEREQMKPAGINLEVQVMTVSGCTQVFNLKGEFPLQQGGFTGRPNPFMTYQQYFGTTGQYNKVRTKYPGVDELLDKIAATYSIQEQKALFSELNRLWVQQVPTIPIFYRGNLSVYSKEIGGEIPNAQGKPDPTSIYFTGRQK